MATPISATCAAPAVPPPLAQKQVSDHAPPAAASAAPDRVGRSVDPRGALLTAGVAAAAQLVPGVVEAEGAAGIATAIGIGLRAASATTAGKVVLGSLSTQLTGYAMSLVHDAAAGQPASKAIAAAGGSLNSLIRSTFGIPQSETP